jgi:mono/diheme cytochrome c family protein
MRTWSILAAVSILPLLLVNAWQTATAGQATGRANQSLVIPSISGSDLFSFYCASCHGREGKGDGPMAAALRTPPSNLTTIAKRNGGQFPRDRVERFVSGDREPAAAAHGSADMPVWGPIFRSLDPRDTLNRVRIENVVSFVESIQEK